MGLVYNICYVRTKKIPNKNHTKKDEMAITCVSWNKKENTCINKICFRRQNFIIKKKKEKITSTFTILQKKKKWIMTWALSGAWT